MGDTFNFSTDRGKPCPMASHTMFPYIDILRYGGELPKNKDGDILVSCPDAEVITVFKLEKIKE
ncbi:TIGR04076 family protein [Anaerosalibacter massiliensis]|uniref:TIGR04076 family protein n=1 Tax=Anaerosalibacter massiliensis TaxID=1347392 RepID=UPI001C9C18D4|nr:TIGR04076 family protein [Anaerosalibacter massiliensis]